MRQRDRARQREARPLGEPAATTTARPARPIAPNEPPPHHRAYLEAVGRHAVGDAEGVVLERRHERAVGDRRRRAAEEAVAARSLDPRLEEAEVLGQLGRDERRAQLEHLGLALVRLAEILRVPRAGRRRRRRRRRRAFVPHWRITTPVLGTPRKHTA
jgi:hypothetical protein